MDDNEDIVAKLRRLQLVAAVLMRDEYGVLDMLHEARTEIVDLRAKLANYEQSSWDRELQQRRLDAFKAEYGEQLNDNSTMISLIRLHNELYSRRINASHRQYWESMWNSMGGRFEEDNGKA
jgi:hypothetical protein